MKGLMVVFHKILGRDHEYTSNAKYTDPRDSQDILNIYDGLYYFGQIQPLGDGGTWRE